MVVLVSTLRLLRKQNVEGVNGKICAKAFIMRGFSLSMADWLSNKSEWQDERFILKALHANYI